MHLPHTLAILASLGAIAFAFGGDQGGTVQPATAIAAGETVLRKGGEVEATYRYRLVEPPATSTEAGARVPLIVFLHGAGERGDDNEAQIKHFVRTAASGEFQRAHPCFILAMQCPKDEFWAAIDLEKFRANGAMPNHSPGPTRSMRAVMQAMDEVLASKPIDRNRVYLTGLSMGGFGAFDLAVRRPELFAAVVPICGGGDPSTAPRIVDIPFYIVHGDDDPIVPVALSRAMRDALARCAAERAGAASAQPKPATSSSTSTPTPTPTPMYREYATVGHDSWTPAYQFGPDGVLDWMFAQSRGGR